jgi:tripartite-type tricarboxylate transporter receptor subunit TctC
MHRVLIGAVFAGLAALNGAATAEEYPSRPVTMVIPFSAGGPTDVLGRLVAPKMAEALGQQVIVENVGGAGGQTGSKRVANSRPDGYSFVIGTVGTHAQSRTLYKHPLFDPVADFTPVALIAQVPIVLIARKNLPVTDFKEFVAYARANQSKMQYGSAGSGSATHLGCVLLNHLIGVNITHIPFRGTAPAMQELAAGRIDYVCDIITTAKPQIEGGIVKGLAILDSKRSRALPDLPTAIEQGTPKLEAYTWNAIFLPKNTPAVIVEKLNAAVLRAIKDPVVRSRLTALGAEVSSEDRATPQFLARLVASEVAKWAVPIKASGVSVD